MRLWASCDTITLDEYLPKLGRETEVAFGLSVAYVGSLGRGERWRGWPFDLSKLGGAALVQLPHVERSFTAVTGSLEAKGPDSSSWWIASVVPITLLGPRREHFNSLIEQTLAGEDPLSCQALGTLSVCGKEVAGKSRRFVTARVHRFQSFCLRAGDLHFGEWFDVNRYAELGSDPDVIAAPVCLAEIELILERTDGGDVAMSTTDAIP